MLPFMAREPRSAENIARQWDDDEMKQSDPAAVIPWPGARDRIADGRLFWWATTRPDGRPHVRPVLAVFIDGVLYSTTNTDARKARNLAADPRFACTVTTDEIDFVLEGTAAPVIDEPMLERIAEAYRSKYGWPVTVRDGAFHAPFGAPTAGPPPYQPYALTPYVILGLGTTERYNLHSTRWRF
jgi:Pyridoxamine 5'-phosphate oxidase